MAREKSRVKKRKFYGNRFDKNAVESHASINSMGDGARVGQSTSNATASASSRKIGFNKPPNSTKRNAKYHGYHFVDMEILSEVFQLVACKECGKSSS